MPTTSYIFQHPYSLGIPLALAALLAALKPAADGQAQAKLSALPARFLVLTILLVGLSIVQSVLFLCLLPTLIVTEAFAGRRRFAWYAAAAIAIAWYMGGMLFTRVPDPPPFGLSFEFWPTASARPDQVLRIAAWYLASLGAVLPLGFLGFRRIRDLRAPLLLLACGCLLVPLFFRYEIRWDIAKFVLVATLALGLPAGALLTCWTAAATVVRRGLVALLVAIMCVSSCSFLFVVLSSQLISHARPMYFVGPVELSADDESTLHWLRLHVPPGEVVYRRPSIGIGYMQNGGVASTPDSLGFPEAFGVRERRVERLYETNRRFAAGPGSIS